MYFLIHAKWQLGREEYEIIEARHMLDAAQKLENMYKDGNFPVYVEMIGPLGMNHFGGVTDE